MLSLEPANVSLSGMKEAEEGGEIIVRVAETEGRAVRAKITWPGNLRAARRLDIIERPLEGVSQPHISGNTVEVAIKPHEIVTLGLQ
jgi:alpha-mannosidase